jgi:hypothetical protein
MEVEVCQGGPSDRRGEGVVRCSIPAGGQECPEPSMVTWDPVQPFPLFWLSHVSNILVLRCEMNRRINVATERAAR